MQKQMKQEVNKTIVHTLAYFPSHENPAAVWMSDLHRQL